MGICCCLLGLQTNGCQADAAATALGIRSWHVNPQYSSIGQDIELPCMKTPTLPQASTKSGCRVLSAL
jgi:hypothetical protein